MRIRFLVTAVAVAATALTLVPAPSAQSSHDTCGGRETDITGTSKSEEFMLTSEKRVINAHGGNDIIETWEVPLELPVTVCMGSGDDILRAGDGGWEAAPVAYLDGGKGFDTATIYICFVGENPHKWTLRNVERIQIINCMD